MAFKRMYDLAVTSTIHMVLFIDCILGTLLLKFLHGRFTSLQRGLYNFWVLTGYALYFRVLLIS